MGMLDRNVIYPHHDPRKSIGDFQRRVQRFKKVLADRKKKLFVLFEPIESQAALDAARSAEGQAFRNVFKTLQKKGCSNFELLAVKVIVGKLSDTTKSAGPVLEKLQKQGCKSGNSSLSIYNLHCVGETTGARMKEKADTDALCDLVVKSRNFSLFPDPVPDESAKTQGTFELHPQRTLSLKNGVWRPTRLN